MRVLVATTAGAGHLAGLLPFARACVRAGHEVRVVAPASFAPAVATAGLVHEPVADADPATGGWRGAPERPQIGRKLLITTAISVVLFALTLLVIESGVLSFRTGLLAPA